MVDIKYSNRALMTDFYELTMAQGYFNQGLIEKEATFELFFRSNPYNGGYTVACGMADAVKFIRNYSFTSEDIEYLESLEMFSHEFLWYLSDLKFKGEVNGVPEGTIVFPFEPIVQVTGPLGILQLLESSLLNIINFQSLIATKAARICYATKRPDTVLEFGLRRAQGDGAIAGSKAAIIGGCVGTSNTLVGKLYGMRVSGTQAHSWVQSFSSELEAFRAYALAFPKNTVLLVDTYDTINSGVPNAIKVGKEMQSRGEKLLGIRIDSGDLAWLAIKAAEMLDKAGFYDTKIVLSSDLNEFVIESIVSQISGQIENEKEREFRTRLLDRLLWGVGTHLITGSGNTKAALGGVYKLVALDTKPVIKISENRTKTTNPGKKQLWRIKSKEGDWVTDLIGLHDDPIPISGDRIHHYADSTKFMNLEDCLAEELHVDLMEKYNINIAEQDIWKESRERVRRQITEQLDQSHLRFLNPHIYKVSLTENLHELKQSFLSNYTSE